MIFSLFIPLNCFNVLNCSRHIHSLVHNIAHNRSLENSRNHLSNMFPSSFLTLLPFIRVLLLSPIYASADVAPFSNSEEYQEGAYGNYTIQTYITEPGFQVPVPNVIVPPQDGASPSKYIIWTPVGFGTGMNNNGPMMLNATDLSLVYRAPMYTEPKVAPWGRESIGATVQTCNGTDYITWWAGKGHWGRKAGRYYVVCALSDSTSQFTDLWDSSIQIMN